MSFLLDRKKPPKTSPGLFKALILSVFLSCLSCHTTQKNKLFIKLKGEQVFEKNKTFKGLKVGGLSEIFFDESSGYFYVLSDDKKNHRFYKMALQTQPCCRMEIKEQFFLKEQGYNKLKRNMDPEALALYEDNVFFIASEGQQIRKKHDPTQIFTFNKQAVLKEAWPVPSLFWKSKNNKRLPSFGQQENKGFESITLDKDSSILWTATEAPLQQDLNSKKNIVRLSAFDIKSKKLISQYAYHLIPGAEKGLTALELLSPKVFISLERDYLKGKTSGWNQVQLFLTNCKKASDIKSQIRLTKKFKACSKKQIWNSSQEKSIKAGNLEGLTLGPRLSPNKKLMILVSDNNFNDKNQKNQFLFFEFNHPSKTENFLLAKPKNLIK